MIGATLVRRLVDAGDRVRVIDDLSVGDRTYLDGVDADLRVASLADRDAVEHALAGVDAVVHLAARAGIADSVRDPAGTIEANVGQTASLLDAARHAGVNRFVLASSNAAVGQLPPHSDETFLPHPISPYGASKLAGEALVQAFAGTYGLAACALRFANAYGPWSLHKRSVVAAWLGAALRGEPITVNGDGEQTRDFVAVDDLAAAIQRALAAPVDAVAGEVFNVGTGTETSLNQLATGVRDAVGRDVEIRHGPARAGDVRRAVSRVEKAADRLGYRARVALDVGLRSTAVWFEDALARGAGRDPARPLSDSD